MKNPGAPNPLNPLVATRHEVLYARLAALTRQIEAAAAKRHEAAVGERTRRLAEDLLFEARRYGRPSAAIPPAAPDLAGLATQLGQAMAALDSFEAAHTAWDETLKCFVWWVRSPVPVPVARLRPKVARAKSPAQSARMAELRVKLARRLDGDKQMRYDAAYADGFRAAQALAAAETAEPPAPPVADAGQASDPTQLSQFNPRLLLRE